VPAILKGQSIQTSRNSMTVEINKSIQTDPFTDPILEQLKTRVSELEHLLST
jgi:hypothetical protein